MEDSSSWKWPRYYWNLFGRVGSETYKTWRWELASSVLVGLVALGIAGHWSWSGVGTVLLPTAIVLGCFVVWHILRAPWLLHKSGTEGYGQRAATAGLFGIVVSAAVACGLLAVGRMLWNARPLGIIEAPTRTSAALPVDRTRLVRVREPCKLTAEQINPARSPQPCPGAPPPTLRDRALAINAHLTEGDRNRFSNALSEFADSLSQGEKVAYKLNVELGGLRRAENDGTIAKTVQQHEKTLSDISAEGERYERSFLQLRMTWDMFREQVEYIFGDNPDNEGPNRILNSSEMYRNYIVWWSVIPNKDQRPILNLLSIQAADSENWLAEFFKWHQACTARLDEMRSSIR